MRTFRKKILLGYGASLLLIIVVLSLAVVLILRLGRASESILQENYRSIQAAENMIDAVERQDSATLLILLGYERQGTAEFRENETLFLQWLGRAKDNITIPGEKEILDNLEKSYTRYLSEISNLQLLYRSEPARATNAYHEVILPLFRHRAGAVAAQSAGGDPAGGVALCLVQERGQVVRLCRGRHPHARARACRPTPTWWKTGSPRRLVANDEAAWSAALAAAIADAALARARGVAARAAVRSRHTLETHGRRPGSRRCWRRGAGAGTAAAGARAGLAAERHAGGASKARCWACAAFNRERLARRQHPA